MKQIVTSHHRHYKNRIVKIDKYDRNARPKIKGGHVTKEKHSYFLIRDKYGQVKGLRAVRRNG